MTRFGCCGPSAAAWRRRTSSVSPRSRSASVSPTQAITSNPASSAWRALIPAVSSVSPKYCRRSERPPDEAHPFGHGKERFFWSFLAAVLIFLAGAVFSIGQGVLELVRSSEEHSYALVYGTLVFAFVAETTSLVRAVRQTRREAADAGKPWRRFLRESTEPTAKTVFGEDTVAVLGLLIAAAG